MDSLCSALKGWEIWLLTPLSLSQRGVLFQMGEFPLGAEHHWHGKGDDAGNAKVLFHTFYVVMFRFLFHWVAEASYVDS